VEELINQAVAQKDWIMLGAASLLLVVPVVLKALGKNVPMLDFAIDLGRKLLLSRAKIVPVEKKPEDEPKGIAAIVDIQDARKGPPEP
jgi:hypothetical protein